MIRRVTIRRFKRFVEETFDLPGHVVVAGPNNTGKTTLLQAVAAWSFGLEQWKQLDNYHRRGGAYELAPIARQAFSAVPLRRFDLLWAKRRYRVDEPIEIEVATNDWAMTIELRADTTEQIYARPVRTHDPDLVRHAELRTVFVPPMTGLSVDEPVYTAPRVNHLLGQSRPGEVLRNLLLEALAKGESWHRLTSAIRRLFHYELLPPDGAGASIISEYRQPDGTTLDVASAGSGFQQVLMLLSFLFTRPGSVLLLDEPDAHLHIILQDAIFGELRAVAATQASQLVIATHSEVIINSVDPSELFVLLGTPRRVADSKEKSTLIRSLGVLSNEDVMRAMDAPGVLYLEDYTDLDILRAWARRLSHAALELLTDRLFWRRAVHQTRPGAEGVPARRHYDAITLVREIPGLELLDGDARAEIQATSITGVGFQRLRWRRYEIESYLLHPTSLERFVRTQVGEGAAEQHIEDLRRHFQDTFPGAVLRDPLGDHALLNGVKARTELLPPALTAAGLPAFPYTRYHEIAALMEPDEIHPEVKEKLDLILKAFNL